MSQIVYLLLSEQQHLISEAEGKKMFLSGKIINLNHCVWDDKDYSTLYSSDASPSSPAISDSVPISVFDEPIG